MSYCVILTKVGRCEVKNFKKQGIPYRRKFDAGDFFLWKYRIGKID